jgi:hypothetical protein
VSTSFADALKAQIHKAGFVPAGGLVAEVDYVTAVRVRILTADGKQDVVYTQLRSRSLEPCAEEGLLRRALRDAVERNG